MKHFVIEINYTVPTDQMAEVTAQHRNFLQNGYKEGILLFSGPKIPKTGGVIIARAENAEALLEFFHNDPFQRKGVANYRYIEFDPVFRQKFLEDWI